MPEFCNPFSVLKNDRKLTQKNWCGHPVHGGRGIRGHPTLPADSREHGQCSGQGRLLDIANEEKEHAGEFLRLLRELDPEEEKFYKEGYEEVEELMAELKK